MAKAKEQTDGKPEEASSGGGIGQLIVSAVLAIVLGAGAGAAFGFLAPIGGSQPATPPKTEAAATPAAAVAGRFPDDAIQIALDPIIIDLDGATPATRIRLELSVVAAHGTPEGSALKSEIREDVIGFVRGLAVTDIQGARGFQSLRQQLEDRAKIRGRGAILGLLINGLAVQ